LADTGTALTLRIPPDTPRAGPDESGPATPSTVPISLGEDALAAEETGEPAFEAENHEPPWPPRSAEDTGAPSVPAVTASAATLTVGAATGAGVASQAAEATSVAESASESDETAPPVEAEFLRSAGTRRKSVAIAYLSGTLALATVLALQLVIMFRVELAAQWPAARPTLQKLCEAMGCRVGWPMRGEMLAVVGTELQSYPSTTALELTAVVRNRADVTLALPAIELTLTDTQNRAVARKVFTPTDYLPPPEAKARLAVGLEAGADLTIRIVFEAPNLNVAGFVVYPFYI
jgi:hypothetical protein